MKMKPLLRSVATAVLAAVMATGCTTRSAVNAAGEQTLFVIVRHAEKSLDEPKDPTLSDTGRVRAQRLAGLLTGKRVAAVYATGYRRTQMTASPTAQAQGLQVQTYAADIPAADFAATLRNMHPAGTVLVIGHSNTVAAIASALCICVVAPLREDEYDRWITVRIMADGKIWTEETHY